MKKTKLVIKREQIKLLTLETLPRVGGGDRPDSVTCRTHVSNKQEAHCNVSILHCTVILP